MKVQDELYGQL